MRALILVAADMAAFLLVAVFLAMVAYHVLAGSPSLASVAMVGAFVAGAASHQINRRINL